MFLSVLGAQGPSGLSVSRGGANPLDPQNGSWGLLFLAARLAPWIVLCNQALALHTGSRPEDEVVLALLGSSENFGIRVHV